jgi:hypothetical protein
MKTKLYILGFLAVSVLSANVAQGQCAQPLTINLSPSTSQTICAGTTTNLAVSVSGGNGSYTYQWQQSINGISNWNPIAVGGNSYSYAATPAQYYRCSITSEADTCVGISGVIHVSVYAPLNAGSISGSQEICFGETPATINGNNASGGDGNYTYRWRQETSTTSTYIEHNAPSYTPTETAPGTYTYYREIKDNSCYGWQQSAGSYTLTIRSALSANTIVSTGETVCFNVPAATITGTVVTGGNGNITYRWKKGNEIIPNSNFPTYTPTETESGTYIYTRQVKDNSCYEWQQSTGSYTLTIRPALTANTIVATGETVCFNTSAATITGTVVTGGDGNITYQWKRGNDIISNSNFPTYTPTETESGTYTYTRQVKDNSCFDWIESVDSYTLTVRPQFNAGSIASTGEIICFGETISQVDGTAANGGDNAISYQWYENNMEKQGATAQNYTPAPTVYGTYVYTRKAKDGICNTVLEQSNGTWTLQVNPLPEVPTIPTGENILCRFTEKTDYAAHADFTTNYIWNIEPVNAGTIMGNGDSVSLFWNPAFWGDAQVKVKSANGCGISNFSMALPITVNPAPVAAFIQAPNPVCANQKELIYAIDSSLSNVSYEWSIENGIITSDIANHKVIVNWNGTSSESTGEISVKLTDNATACHFTATEQIAISSLNAPNLNEITAKIAKDGKPYMLIYPNPTGDFGYQWYKNNIKIDDATEQFYYPPQYGQTLDLEAEYRVYVADMNNLTCGNFTEVYTLSKKMKLTAKYFTVSPNPVHNGNFTVSFNKSILKDKVKGLLTVSSLAGQKLWEQPIETPENIPVSVTLSPGIYIVTFTTSDKQQFAEKIIINNN